MFSWLAQEQALTNAALTVRAQTISPIDTGRLSWPTFFPQVPVDSTRLADIVTLDFRPTADRREWNQRGRQVNLKTPNTRIVEMLPVESYFKIEEYEIQKIEERVFGNQDLFRQIVGPAIPQRTDVLVDANFRRIEVDAMYAWANGSIVVRDPQGNAANKTVSLGFAAGRYITAGTAWNDAGVNAYDELLTAYEAATDLMGFPAGVMLRLATFKEIQKDAPRPVNAANVQLTREELRARVEADTGRPFNFFINEESVDIANDGGTDVTRTKLWTAHKVAFIPEGLRVGSTYFAPVARAFDIARGAPEAGIDVRGMTAYTEVGNNGRELTVEVQVNALSIPNEQVLYVVDAGV